MWTPAICSAARTEARMAAEVAGTSPTTPLLIPVDGAAPTPRISIWSSPDTSATRVQTFVVPMSSPTTISLFATYWVCLQPMPADHGEVQEDPAAEGHHRRQVEFPHPDLVPQVDQGHRQ